MTTWWAKMQSNSLIDKMTAHVQTTQFSGYGNGSSPQQLSVFFEDFDAITMYSTLETRFWRVDKENI